jgi:hypothetical protein
MGRFGPVSVVVMRLKIQPKPASTAAIAGFPGGFNRMQFLQPPFFGPTLPLGNVPQRWDS